MTRWIVYNTLAALALAGCSKEPPPPPPEPKLESSDPDERAKAAKRAGEKFGAPEEGSSPPGNDKK